jgi:hypothetical protein
VSGRNWGAAAIEGQTLVFRVGRQPAFRIPLQDVGQVQQSREEVRMHPVCRGHLHAHSRIHGPGLLLACRARLPACNYVAPSPVDARLLAQHAWGTGAAVVPRRKWQIFPTPEGLRDAVRMVWQCAVCSWRGVRWVDSQTACHPAISG